jgi:hypothetical protein
MACFDVRVEQFRRAIEARGVSNVRVVEQKDRPLILRRKIVPREGIDVC